MQSLWSRAGQAHRCGCKVCDTALTGLGRRASTAARRRKPTFAEVFTACYSSVFATAAIVDAVRKEDRRQDLDRQLDETRRELAELQRLQALETSRSAAVSDDNSTTLTIDQMDELWKSLKDIYTNRPFMKEIDKPVTLRTSEFLARLKDDYYRCPDEETMQALRRTDYEFLEQAIIAEESDTSVVTRTPRTSRQLFNDSRTMVHLVTQLLDRANAQDKSSTPSPSYDEARQLASKHSHGYTFPSFDPARAKHTTSILNKNLRELVSSPTLSLKEKVGRVCYNLLISPYTADMQTYNTLIVAFDKHGHRNLAESLVNSFYYYRRLKPTPSTFVAILNHYKITNNHGRFLRALACITGLDTQTGAKVSRRHVSDDKATEEFKQSKLRTKTGDWIWEHVSLSQPLVEAIMNGLLHFKLFDQAATFFVSCMKANVSLSTNIIKQMFDEFILALDWRAAVRLIRGFTILETRWPGMLLDREWDDASYLIDRVYVLLDICGLQTQGQPVSNSTLTNLSISSAKFDRFLQALDRAQSLSQQDATDSLGDAGSSDIEDIINASKSRLLQIESIWKEQAFVGSTTRSIESKLLYPDFSPRFRALMAMHIGESATEASLKLNEEFVEFASTQSEAHGLSEILAECERFRTSMEPILDKGPEVVQDSASAAAATADVAIQVEDKQGEIEEELSGLSIRPQQDAVGPWRPALTIPIERTERKTDRLRETPRRLLTWTVPSQRPAYSQPGQWVELG